MFLDLSAGILIGLGIQPIFGPEISGWLILFGAAAAIAPDLDAIIYGFWQGWKIDHFWHEHRDILHYPIFFVLMAGILIAPYSLEICFIWTFATLWHFIHNTLEGGWGVRWLYPIWDKYICLKLDGPRPKIIMGKQEQREIAAEYGDPDWLSKRVEFSAKFIAEIAFFVITCVIAVLMTVMY